MEVLSKVISFILVAVLVLLLPLKYLLGHQHAQADGYVKKETILLVDDIRDRGYINVGMYEEFIKKLCVTGELFDVEIEHAIPAQGDIMSAMKDLPGAMLVSANPGYLPSSSDDSGVITSFAAHTHTDDCYEGHRHTVACESMPITFSIIRNGSFDDGSTISIYVYCGYCQKLIYSVNIADRSMQKNIAIKNHVNSSRIFINKYEDFDAYWAASKQMDQLIRNLDPYITYNESWAGNGSSYYKKNGYVPGENLNFELPYMERISDCTFCDGVPMVFNIIGWEESSDHSYHYSFICPYCSEVLIGVDYNWWSDNTYRVVIYKNGSIYATYTDTNALQPFYNLLSSLPHNEYDDVNSMIASNNPILQFDFLNEALNHGCNYPTAPCRLEEDITPICDRVVTSITATNPVQTAEFGGAITTTATATFLDGHTTNVNCTSNYNPNMSGVQTVTLNYFGLVGNAKTNGTKTCVMTVTVRENNIPSYLTIIPSTYTVYNGSEPSYIVKLVYKNGISKAITGYTKSGWTSSSGTKTVTFTYTEKGITVSKSVTIIVKPNLSDITVTPASQVVERYTEPVFKVCAFYEDGSFKYVAGTSITRYNKNTIGVQNVTVSYTENGVTQSTVVQVEVTPMRRVCPVCGNSYYLDIEDFDPGCPCCKTKVSYIQVSPNQVTTSQNGSLNINVTATYLDGHTEDVVGWSSNFDSSKIGLQLVKVTFRDKFAYVSVMVTAVKTCDLCGADYSLEDNGIDPGCPFCKETLILINASPSYQSVNQGDEIELTVRGVFKDGHTEVIKGWHSDYDKNTPGEQQVTVYYRDKSCTVTVEVVSELQISCSVCGTVYNLREHPWGCPVCKDTLTGIEASLQNGGNLIPYGSELDLIVVLTFRDGHRGIALEGWEDNFDPYMMGDQKVTVSSTDRFGNTVSCMLELEVTDRLVKIVCENGHVYYTDDPSSECPYCASNQGEKAGDYYIMSFTEEILEKLYTVGIYYMNAGDYVSVKVTMKTQGSIYSFNLFHRKKEELPLTYGGEVA